VLAASLPAPPPDGSLSVRVRVMDEDGFLTGDDDQIGEDTFTFGAAEDFGAAATTHVRDQRGYRITLSVAKRVVPIPPIGRRDIGPPATASSLFTLAVPNRRDSAR
jgi:hypothetical protein